jgi:hypothetical protein
MIAQSEDRKMYDLVKEKTPLIPRYIGKMILDVDGNPKLSVGLEFVSTGSELAIAQFNKLILTVDRGNSVIDIRGLNGR